MTCMKTYRATESEFQSVLDRLRPLRVNLGCGSDVRAGWINVDKVDLPGITLCHDLTQTPLPFDDNSCVEVVCQDVLEHIDYIPVLKEIHRILQVGGTLTIRVPHFTSKDAYADPTHCNFFATKTFRFFAEGHDRSYYFDFAFSKVRRIHIQFDRRVGYMYNYLLELLVNSATTAQNYYEGSPLRIFPATNMTVVLEK